MRPKVSLDMLWCLNMSQVYLIMCVLRKVQCQHFVYHYIYFLRIFSTRIYIQNM